VLWRQTLKLNAVRPHVHTTTVSTVTGTCGIPCGNDKGKNVYGNEAYGGHASPDTHLRRPEPEFITESCLYPVGAAWCAPERRRRVGAAQPVRPDEGAGVAWPRQREGAGRPVTGDANSEEVPHLPQVADGVSQCNDVLHCLDSSPILV